MINMRAHYGSISTSSQEYSPIRNKNGVKSLILTIGMRCRMNAVQKQRFLRWITNTDLISFRWFDLFCSFLKCRHGDQDRAAGHPFVVSVWKKSFALRTGTRNQVCRITSEGTNFRWCNFKLSNRFKKIQVNRTCISSKCQD